LRLSLESVIVILSTQGEITTMTKQMTDAEIKSMLDRNGLYITFSTEKQKYELFQKVGKHSLFMASCEYQTPLIASARNIDKRHHG